MFDAAGQFRTDIKIDEIEVPENVRLVINRRLERFDENEKRALAAAAVSGRSVSIQLLTAESRIDVDELSTVIEKAPQMGLIASSSEGPERPFTAGHEPGKADVACRHLDPTPTAPARELPMPSSWSIPVPSTSASGEITDHLRKAGSFVDRQKLIRWLTLASRAH